ncbi:hypothetical protein ABZP36_032719 [Zizania latifolia]
MAPLLAGMAVTPMALTMRAGMAEVVRALRTAHPRLALDVLLIERVLLTEATAITVVLRRSLAAALAGGAIPARMRALALASLLFIGLVPARSPPVLVTAV